MLVTTLTGTVENGQIRLADNVRLPEKATVYVVIPGIELSPAPYIIASPKLVHREQAAAFTKEVVKEARDAGVGSPVLHTGCAHRTRYPASCGHRIDGRGRADAY